MNARTEGTPTNTGFQGDFGFGTCCEEPRRSRSECQITIIWPKPPRPTSVSSRCLEGAAIPLRRAIARTALTPYQGRRAAPGCAVSDLLKRGSDAPDFAFRPQDSDLRGAALFCAPQGRPRRPRLAHRSDQPALARTRGCRDLPADLRGCPALARDQRRLRRAAQLAPGYALQYDRNIFQSDPALLDRRRCHAALAAGAWRRRMAPRCR